MNEKRRKKLLVWRNKIEFAGTTALKWLFSPIPFFNKSLAKGERKKTFWYYATRLARFKIFPENIPSHYPLNKKLALLKSQSPWGKVWDTLLILLSVIACGFYVSETYTATYEAVRIYANAETIYTQFFLVDFLFSFASAPNLLMHLINPWTIVDFATIFPYFLTLLVTNSKKRVNLSLLRFVRILRLVRILRTFKLLGGLSGVKRQIITLSLTLTSLVFMAAGIFEIMENGVKHQMEYKCQYINGYTNWEPSCSQYSLVDCDCSLHNCKGTYTSTDLFGEPSTLKCTFRTFLDCFYYLVVTGI